MLTTPRSTTRPANDTVPPVTASTGAPAVASRSMPRWPAAYRCSGARQGSTTVNPGTGDAQSDPGGTTVGGIRRPERSARNTPERRRIVVVIRSPCWLGAAADRRPC
ncbi:hypothetical protein [Rathayibacter sp. VKM Ac-2630]|uniref:hypothetical protein n=1 Tax=Rathayibacter sp. VKM Ac-2630 TaxID=1938617 RepID=UPI001F49099C|nr:hypothetical protein [Rathayibacter sp. VKM Ac-2630]